MLKLRDEECMKQTWTCQKSLPECFGLDRERGLFVIKPSGVSYEEAEPENLVILRLDSNVVEGEQTPSSRYSCMLVSCMGR